MAGRAESKVGTGGNTEIVENIFLAQLLSGSRIEEIPGPMGCLVNLFGRLGMTGQAGLGHFGTGPKVLVEFLELAVIRGGFRGECGTAQGTHGN